MTERERQFATLVLEIAEKMALSMTELGTTTCAIFLSAADNCGVDPIALLQRLRATKNETVT